MKPPYILIVSLLCLLGCKKSEQAAPLIDAAFNQQILLHYQQTATLPNQSAPELTLTVEDINDSRCPKEANCILPGEVPTVLGVKDQSGSSQTLTLRLIGISTTPDSAVVQANGRNYTVVLHEVTPYPSISEIAKKDKHVLLTVKRR